MSKSLIAAVAATGVAATAAPTTFLANSASSGGSGGKSNVEPIKTQFEAPSWTSRLLDWNSANDIQTKYGEVNCLKEDLKNTDWSNSSAGVTLPSDVAIFETSSSSCLIVEYYKQEYQESKWWGEFKLVWFLKDNKQGLVTAVHAKPSNGKLMGNSVAYFLKKETNENQKWKLESKKENGVTEINANTLSSLIPQSGTSIKEEGYQSLNYWNFGMDAINACGDGKCTNTKGSPTQEYAIWNFTSSVDGSHIKGWSKNLYDWINKAFEWGSLVSQMEIVKGNWTKGGN